jgi:glycosyltransferase involved in cell wall biosynthesis
MPRMLQSKVLEEEVNEAATRALEKGLLRKIVTNNRLRYEITDTGWQFVKEYQDIQRDLGENKGEFTEDNSGLLGKDQGLPESITRKLRLEYEVMKPAIGVVIPTLNEASSIRNVLNEIPKHVQYPLEIIVIDASDDETPLVAAQSGARVLRQDGQGKGNALRQAFCALDSDIVLMMDGDGSMQAQEIPRLVEAVVSGADVAKGSRFLRSGGSEDLSFVRKIGNYLFVSLVNVLWSAKYTDLCYGFVAFRRQALEKLKPYLTSSQFQIETEICIKAKKVGLRVTEVPSMELRRTSGQSKLYGIRDSLSILWVIVREFMSKL